MSRQDIIAQLRLDNPTTTDDTGNRHGTGSAYYESMIEAWADAMESAPSLNAALVVSPRQIRLALLDLSISPDSITERLANHPAALIEWEYASYIERGHPLVASLAAALGLSEAQVDDLFSAAQSL